MIKTYLSWPHHRFIHGKSRTPIHNIWLGMRGRCNNTKNPRYKDYGGRGISVCARWDTSFEAFYFDMGEVIKGKSIDRLNNNLHYSCGKCSECRRKGWKLNCKWSTIPEQARNKRSNRLITYKGETKLLTEWAKQFKIQRQTLTRRIDKWGWSVAEALIVPTRRFKYK